MSKLFVFNRINIIKDFSIAFIIFISPFLFFLYTIAPKDTTEWKTRFFYINLQNSGYEIDVLLWRISTSLLYMITIGLWFVTCKHWWRYFILISFLLEVYKFFGYYYEVTNFLIEFKSYNITVLSLTLIFLLLFISKKLNYYSSSKSINQQIDEEINLMMQQVSNYKKEDYKEFKSKLILLRKQKLHLEKKEYLIQLIKLREDFAINTKNK